MHYFEDQRVAHVLYQMIFRYAETQTLCVADWSTLRQDTKPSFRIPRTNTPHQTFHSLREPRDWVTLLDRKNIMTLHLISPAVLAVFNTDIGVGVFSNVRDPSSRQQKQPSHQCMKTRRPFFDHSTSNSTRQRIFRHWHEHEPTNSDPSHHGRYHGVGNRYYIDSLRRYVALGTRD